MAVNPQQTLIQDKEKQPTKTGTGFVNLQKYLQANQGNKLGQAVSGNIQAAGQQTQQNVQKQQEEFQNKLAQARSGIGQTQQNVTKTLGQFEQPNNFQGVTDQDVKTFEDLRNNKYSGPVGFTNPQQLEKDSARAASLGQLAQSRGGRQELLRSTIQAPQYTAAQQRLDELLMSLGGGAKDVRRAGQEIKQVAPNISQQIQEARSKGLQTARDYANLQKQAYEGVKGQSESIQDAINKQLSQANLYRQQTVLPLVSSLQNKQLTPEQAAALGLDPMTAIYNVNPSQYFSLGAAPQTSNIETSDQQARLNALNRLSGRPVDETQLSQYNPFTFKKPDFEQAVASQKSAYENELMPIIAERDQMLNSAFGRSMPDIIRQNYQNKINELQNKYNVKQSLSGQNLTPTEYMPGYPAGNYRS